MRRYQHWINGKFIAPAGGKYIERISPAHGGVLASFALGDSADVDIAIKAARLTFESGDWRNLSGGGKAAVMNRLADLMQAKSDELAKMESEESGKPINAARAEIDYSIELTRYAAAVAWNIPGEVMSHNGPGKLGFVLREPRGVVGMILPWNYPAVCLMQKLPFALAAGCSVVIKPSEFTSGTALEIAQLGLEAGLPAGQINVVTGTGPDVGEALTTHSDVDMISFTGSSAIGKRIARNAAERIGRVALELGGKGANIIFADADLDAAVEGALQGFTINQGEECCAGSRILVEKSIADEFLRKLTVRAGQMRMGMPMDSSTEIGPMIHEKHLERVLGYINKGKQEGAQILVGGERASTGALAKGYFLPPTVFSGVTPDMAIFKEEIFGPVASVVVFHSLDEAVEIANKTPYGLANGVWTKNLDKAMAVMRRLRSGMVYVNSYLETIPQLPFGGMKESGVGRENGVEGVLEFMEVKAAFVKLQSDFPA